MGQYFIDHDKYGDIEYVKEYEPGTPAQGYYHGVSIYEVDDALVKAYDDACKAKEDAEDALVAGATQDKEATKEAARLALEASKAREQEIRRGQYEKLRAEFGDSGPIAPGWH